MFEQTKALCQHFLDMGVPCFDLIVYKDGECILRHMGGYADRENKTPMTGKEKYHIYSCSKLITCAAAMQLWEKGLFSLDDNVSDYLPAFADMTVKTEDGVRKAKNPIKIKHLFQMTSGMNYDMHTPELEEYYSRPDHDCPTIETVNMFARTPLEYEPGESWMYSLSHDVLGALVEVLSGEKFEDYVKTHIFDPLGMVHSTFLHPLEDWEGFAKQYHYNEETGEFMPVWRFWCHLKKDYASGGGGCISTVEDYIKFLEAMRIGDVILKKETVALMAQDHLTDRQRAIYVKKHPSGTSYGLGMRVTYQDQTVTEFGWGGAAGAFASVDSVNNITIFYAQHVLKSPNRALRNLLHKVVVADLEGKTFDIPFTTKDANPSLTY